MNASPRYKLFFASPPQDYEEAFEFAMDKLRVYNEPPSTRNKFDIRNPDAPAPAGAGLAAGIPVLLLP